MSGPGPSGVEDPWGAAGRARHGIQAPSAGWRILAVSRIFADSFQAVTYIVIGDVHQDKGGNTAELGPGYL